ncbi:hypothetical protein A0U40_11085 [[Bacillus] sp. KCTC 13219]|nr:hypothetical protein A0U40_11085 [[Bacillus] sp. KCTC 13219]
MTNPITNAQLLASQWSTTKDARFINEDGKDFYDSLLDVFNARDKKQQKTQSESMFNMFSYAGSVALGKGLLSGAQIPEGIHPFLDTHNQNGVTAESFLQTKMQNSMLQSLTAAKGNLEQQLNTYKSNSIISTGQVQKMEANIALVEQFLVAKKEAQQQREVMQQLAASKG